MEKIKIFISYKRVDASAAKAVVTRLSEVGIQTFIDEQIPTEALWEEYIKEQIADCSHVLVICSNTSRPSPGPDYVEREVQFARELSKRLIPILIHENAKLDPNFESKINYPSVHALDVTSKEAPLFPDKDLFKLACDYNFFTDGIAPVAFLRKISRRLPNEFFATELLAQPVTLSRQESGIWMTINRADVQNVVLDNSGKRRLCKTHAQAGDGSILPEIWQCDREAHDFFSGKDRAQNRKLHALPLRWASGGVLPLVRFRGRQWVQLFFRDVPPYGWNLPLGASERQFTEGVASEDALESELCHPWRLMVREFLEEVLILRGTPQAGGEINAIPFQFDIVDVDAQAALAKRFSDGPIRARQKEDVLTIRRSETESVHVRLLNQTGCSIRIFGGPDGKTYTLRDVFCAVNPTELGVEVVKALEFDLRDDDYILDGEFYEVDQQKELVRMPVGLLSMDYVKRTFLAQNDLQYSADDLQPSIEGEAMKDGDLHLFPWDVTRRKELLAAISCMETGSRQRKRLEDWQRNFADAFAAPGVSAIPPLFTPTTAKILTYYVASLTGKG